VVIKLRFFVISVLAIMICLLIQSEFVESAGNKKESNKGNQTSHNKTTTAPASAEAKEISLVDLINEGPLYILDSPIGSGSFSPDGHYLAVGSYQEVRVYDTNSWKRIATINVKSRYGMSVSFSDNGKYLEAMIDSTGDSYVFIYEVGSWKAVTSMTRSEYRLFADEYKAYFYYTKNLEYGQVIKGISYRAINEKWFVGWKVEPHGNIAGSWVESSDGYVFDMTPLSLNSLRKDLRDLGFSEQSKTLTSQSQLIEADFQQKLKIIESEKNDAMKQLGGTQKDEFETEAEYKSRLANRETKIKTPKTKYHSPIKVTALKKAVKNGIRICSTKFRVEVSSCLIKSIT